MQFHPHSKKRRSYPSRELGVDLAALSDRIKIALAPVKATVWGYERIEERLLARLTSLLAERRVAEIKSPPLPIAGPVSVNLIFASNQKPLCEMYLHLLASIMDVRTEKVAHPSFVAVIQQLSGDEVLIIKAIIEMNGQWRNWYSPTAAMGTLRGDVWEPMRNLCASVGIHNPELADLYIENFIRLRLLRDETASESEYRPEYTADNTNYMTGEYELIELTAYGRAFVNTCILDVANQRGDPENVVSRRS